MSQPLLFRFIGPERVEWLLEGATPERGTLAELAARAAGLRLLLAVPGETVTLTRASVAARNRATWLRAIPFALEDGLVEDVETLHFAVGEAPTGSDVPVVVVSHETLRSWLAACAVVGITPAAVIPDVLLLPLAAQTWSVLLENGRALVRTGLNEGFVTERDNLSLFLELALAEAGDHPPHRLRVWGGELPENSSLPVEVQPEERPGEVLEVLAAGLREGIVLNLLQGPYSRKAHLGRWLRPWRAAAILAGLWLGLQAALQVSDYWQLSREEAALRTEMEQIYKDAVPGARRIINPRAQLENRLQELRAGARGGDTGLLALLYRGGQPLLAFDAVMLRGLRYKDGQLDLDLVGGSLEILDDLKRRFANESDLQTQMRTTKREDKVESQVVLRKASS